MSNKDKHKLRELAFSHITRESIKRGCMQAKNVPIVTDIEAAKQNGNAFKDVAGEFLEWMKLPDTEFNDLDEKIPNNPKDAIGASKPNLALVPSAGLIQAALAMTNGAKKYGPYNWREADKKVGYMTYIAAAQRHLLALIDGENVALDSGVSHLGHIAAGCMILIDAIECGNAIDDRPLKGAAARILNEYLPKNKGEV